MAEVDIIVVVPYATAVLIFLASMISVSLSIATGFKPLLYLGVGLFAVTLQSALDGYIVNKVDTHGGWDSISGGLASFYLLLDSVRGFLIVFWASIEVSLALQLSGSSTTRRRLLPVAILVGGSLYTVFINHFSGVEPLSKRILVSSAGRVFLILIPAAFYAGLTFLRTLWRTTGNKGFLGLGVALLLHGSTLPFYSIAKESGLLAFSLWYLMGGLIPAFIAVASLSHILSNRELLVILDDSLLARRAARRA